MHCVMVTLLPILLIFQFLYFIFRYIIYVIYACIYMYDVGYIMHVYSLQPACIAACILYTCMHACVYILIHALCDGDIPAYTFDFCSFFILYIPVYNIYYICLM